MSHGGQQDEIQKINCAYCGLLVGFSHSEISIEIICIYCQSEETFFRRTFSGSGDNLYIFATIEEDQSAWRRGLMHSRKQSIRWAFEDIKE